MLVLVVEFVAALKVYPCQLVPVPDATVLLHSEYVTPSTVELLQVPLVAKFDIGQTSISADGYPDALEKLLVVGL